MSRRWRYALEEFPRFNASLTADGETLVLKQYCHIGIAVDTPHGLMVPVIRDVDKQGPVGDCQRDCRSGRAGKAAQDQAPTRWAAPRCRSPILAASEAPPSRPIVNPPEVAILGITRTEMVPVWENDSWTPVPMVPLDLSYDHRVINGAEAARFMAHLCRSARRSPPDAECKTR
jgi:pyruvate/2-oxoglutarate dehydrogenase complex dihydrolipoamide acyltransferase (E2) component